MNSFYFSHSQDQTVALAWSFTNDFKDMPYTISRIGNPKSEGGKGTVWKCTCPAFANRGGKTCKHLITLREEAKSGSILADKRFTLTEFGIKVLKLNPYG